MDKIAAYVNKEDIIVRAYERGQFTDGSLYADFFQCIGLPFTDEYKLNEKTDNEGLQGNYVEIKRLMNSVPEYKESRNDFMWRSVRNASAAASKKYGAPKVSMFPYEEQLAYLKRYEESNRRVAREYLGREAAVLFYDPVQALPAWEVDPDTMTRDLLYTFTEVFCAQEQKIAKLREEMDSMHNSLVFRTYRKLRKLIKHESEGAD